MKNSLPMMKKRMMPVRISAKEWFRLNTLEISLAPRLRTTIRRLVKIINILTGINVVHAFNAEQYQNDKFNKPSLDMMNVQVKNQKLFALVQPTMTLGMNGLALTIYWTSPRRLHTC